MKTPDIYPISSTDSGYWRVLVNPLPASNSAPVDVTFVRGAATTVSTISTTDPFGPAAATIIFPSITLLDSIGTGELDWLVPEANVDICWMKPQAGPNIPITDSDVIYRWEGYFVSFEFGEDDAGSTLTVSCNGAMKQMDNYLAYPEYLSRPISFEYAIERQFDTDNRPDSRLKKCIPFKKSALTDFLWYRDDPAHVFNAEDYKNFNSKDAIYNSEMSTYFKPANLKTGDTWTGLLTRSTGNFDSVLSNYIQGMLESMQTSKGSFTLLLKEGRQPYFKHRTRLTQPDDDTLIVDVLWPGVKVSLTQDFSQKINVVYGSGKALNNDAYSNIVFSADGSQSHYQPFAYSKENYPPRSTNKNFDKNKMSKEVNIKFFDGLNAADAKIVAKKHLEMFSDPGITANLNLTSNPQDVDGNGVPRQTIAAGQSILIKNLLGRPEGILFHITEASYSSDGGSVSLVLDSKYRNQLTVQEVRKRGKDSLVLSRLLGVGQYQPNIDDLLFPWSYEQGSGFIPLESKRTWDLANKSNLNVGDFPWTNMTQKFPPKTFASVSNANKSGGSSSNPYASLFGPADTNDADKNWTAPIPVMFSARGSIMAVRFAAYDDDGNIYKVPFHVSLWYESSDGSSGLSYYATPALSSPEKWDTPLMYSKAQNSRPITATATLSIGTVLQTGADGATGATGPNGTYIAKLQFLKPSDGVNLDGVWYESTKFKLKDVKIIGPDTTQKKNPVKATAMYYTVDSIDYVNNIVTFYVNKNQIPKTGASQTVAEIWYLANDFDSPVDGNIIPDGFHYKWGQHYPFYPQAWETKEIEGNDYPDTAFVSPNHPIAGWGTYYEQAGFYPGQGSISEYSPATGLFADDSPFSYDFTSLTTDQVLSSDTPAQNVKLNRDGSYNSTSIKRVSGNALFYCDQEYDEATNTLVPRKRSVHFIGRLYRQPPGA